MSTTFAVPAPTDAPPRAGDELITTEQLAAELGISRASLEQLRAKGGGPAFIRISPRAIRYRRSAVEAYLAARTEQPGSKGAE